jgi:polysaccharide export outer membrane protein
MKAVIKVWAVCAIVVLFGSTYVSAQETNPAKTVEKSNTEKAKPDAAIAETAAEAANTYRNQANDKYRIGFQDTIEVQVFRHPELSRVVNINPDGTIRMPRVSDPIIAVCKTETELENTITAYYKSYLKDPFVTVRYVESRSQPFSVIGAVQKPGSFNLYRKIRLLELLTLAGGHDVENAGAKIQVARFGSQAGCREDNKQTAENAEEKFEFIGYNLADVLQGKENPWMQPGDIVSVLVAEEAYVVGNVKEPKKIVLREAKTLTQALAEAGGITSLAKTDKVVIQRQEPNGVKKELVFDLKDIRSQKIPDPQLQGNDIVQVSTDRTKSLSKGFLDILKGSIPLGVTRF